MRMLNYSFVHVHLSRVHSTEAVERRSRKVKRRPFFLGFNIFLFLSLSIFSCVQGLICLCTLNLSYPYHFKRACPKILDKKNEAKDRHNMSHGQENVVILCMFGAFCATIFKFTASTVAWDV